MSHDPRLRSAARAARFHLALGLSLLALAAPGCRGPSSAEVRAAALAISAAPRSEAVPDTAAWVPVGSAASARVPAVRLERISAGVPWPRGLALVDDRLVVVARGRHRNAGGVDASIDDAHGSLFAVDPRVSEPVVAGELASPAVSANARVLAGPGEQFHVYRGDVPPAEDVLMDRPYCTLVYDAESDNLFLCGYSGVDLPGRKFRKNATDSVHRYDLRTKRWHVVEMHDAAAVPTDELGYVVPNQYYPHHDVELEPAPHGWVNGPDAACVAGRYLYVAGKDNHLVARYDLSAIRRDPEAGPPPSRAVLGPDVVLSKPDGVERVQLLGPSALVARDGWLYVGYRTTSVVVRFRLDGDGALVDPEAAELIAVFEPWDPERGRSANLIDMAFDPDGALYVSCAKEGGIWRVGVPDPARPFFGNDQVERPPSAPMYVRFADFTGKKTGCGNLVFDEAGRLYVCSGNYDSESTTLAGVIYRVTPVD